MTARVWLPCLIFAAGCSSTPETTQPPEKNALGSWTTKAPMPTRRAEVAAALLGDRVYVAGGYEGPYAFEVYDLVADAWQTLGELPLPLDHASLAAIDGSIYLAGGGSARLFAYDPESDVWTERHAPPYDRYASAAVVANGELYLIGGLGPAPETPLRYAPLTDEWSTLAPMSVRRDHVGAVVVGGEIVALSGRAEDGSNFVTTEIYDPSTDAWRPGTSMHEGRSGFGASVLGGKVYVAGGELIVDPVHTQDSVEVWDPESNTWSFVTPLPEPIHGTSAISWGERLWLFGGSNVALSAIPHDGTVYVFTP